MANELTKEIKYWAGFLPGAATGLATGATAMTATMLSATYALPTTIGVLNSPSTNKKVDEILYKIDSGKSGPYLYMGPNAPGPFREGLMSCAFPGIMVGTVTGVLGVFESIERLSETANTPWFAIPLATNALSWGYERIRKKITTRKRKDLPSLLS